MQRTRFIALFLLFGLLPLAAEFSVTARFDPPKIADGGRARYIVEITETAADRMPEPEPVASLPIPDPGDLELRNGRTSTSRQTRIVNASTEYRLTQSLVVDAVPPGTGTYTIPGYTIPYKGRDLRAPAASLEVVARAADAAPTVDELLFLRAELPDALYVGQSVRTDLKLYVSDDVRLTGLNAFDREADGFTVSDLPEEQEESVEVVDGHRYRVLTWPLVVTPISAGAQSLEFQLNVTARVPEPRRPRRDPFGRSPFGSSILDNFFGRSERINLFTEPMEIEVKPLPEAGRPPVFTGAIGDFNMEVFADAETTQTGEPILLSVRLSGAGNFDRIAAPPLPDAAGWRQYDPETKFQADDAFGLRGSKRFDYVFLPERSGSLELPPVTFAFFDPEAERYVTLESPPIPVEVEGATSPTAPVPSPAADGNGAAGDPEADAALSAETRLLLPQYQNRPGRAIRPSWLRSPALWSLNAGALIALLVAGVFLRRQKRLRQDHAFAQQQAIRKAYHHLKAQLDQASPEHLLTLAPRLLRHHLSLTSGCDLRNADRERLRDATSGPEAREALDALLDTGDAARFAAGPSLPDPEAFRRQLRNFIA